MGAFHSTQNSGNFGWYQEVGTSNGTVHFGWHGQTRIFGTSSKGLTEMSLSIWQNCCPQYCSFILFTRTITKPAVAWVGSVQPEYTVLLRGMWNFRNFKPDFFLNGKRPMILNLELCLVSRYNFSQETKLPSFYSTVWKQLLDFPLLNTLKEVISSKSFQARYDYETSQHRWPSIHSALTVMVLTIGVTFQIIEALLTAIDSITWIWWIKKHTSEQTHP